MPVYVDFVCGGCGRKEKGTDSIRREFVSFSGRSSGFGPRCGRETRGVLDVVPEGWVAFDPYTYCTYCPSCWADVVRPEGEAKEEQP